MTAINLIDRQTKVRRTFQVSDPFNPCRSVADFGHFAAAVALRYIRRRQNAEGSHNGSAAVLKTADRKVMQVRVLSPPPFPF
jgi:hypothetical protein